MAMKLSCLFLLLLLLSLSCAKKQKCPTSVHSCDECIQSGAECAWCTDPNASFHCDTMKRLMRAGCQKSYLYNPQSSVQVIKNDSRTDPGDTRAVFLQPQELSLHLRPGVSQSFPLSISMPTDHPTTNLTMDTSNIPAGFNITFSSKMKGNPLLVQVNVEAARCPSKSDISNQNSTGPWSVQISPRGFALSVMLQITLQCQCNCTENREEKSPVCHGQGALVCGRCECHAHYAGNRCQITDSFSLEDEESCRSAPNALVCSGRGVCVLGACKCYRRENPDEKYSGQFCECSNFNCLYNKNKICGGNGKCICGMCVCDNDWTGEDCSCSMQTASCMAKNQKLCSGRGICECGTCRCESLYKGPTCEDCPVCQGKCQEHAACVECKAFGTGPKTNMCDRECSYLNVTMVESKDDIPREIDVLCRMRSYHDSCSFTYTFSSAPSGGQSTVVRAKEC